MRIDGKGRLLDVGQIRFAALVERRGHTDEDGVEFFELREIGGGAKVPAMDELLDLISRNVFDVGLATIEHGHFLGVRIKSRDFVPCFGKAQRQRQAHVSAADDCHFELCAFENLRFPVNGHLLLFTPRDLAPGGVESAKSRFRGSGFACGPDSRSIPTGHSADVAKTGKYSRFRADTKIFGFLQLAAGVTEVAVCCRTGEDRHGTA